jgi:hypothetical protein
MLKWKMKQWIYALMMIVMLGSASAAFFIPSNGQEGSGSGIFAGLGGFFTIEVCTPHWVASTSECLVNDTKLKIYTDDRNCGSPVNLPADNGTLYGSCNYCSYNLQYTAYSSCDYNNNTQRYEFNGSVFDANYASCCAVTGISSDCYMDDALGNRTYTGAYSCEKRLNMEVIAISIIMIGIMFFLIYLATTLSSRDPAGNVVPLNAMIKILLYGGSSLIAFFTIQLALGISIAYTMSQAIESNLNTIYQAGIVIAILILIIIFYGTMVNVLHGAAIKLGNMFRKRSNHKK